MNKSKTSQKYAVFLEPSGDLRELIVAQKEKIRSELPSQPYCDHPPHCTLYVSFLKEEPSAWLPVLQSALQSETAFHIDIIGTHIFYDDPLTQGGHTLIFRIAASKTLRNMQMAVCEALSSFVDTDSINEHQTPLTRREPYKTSIQRYGFPFCGTHWIPHFSVASLQTQRTHQLITDFADIKATFRSDINLVSAWQINGESHAKLAEFPLEIIT